MLENVRTKAVSKNVYSRKENFRGGRFTKVQTDSQLQQHQKKHEIQDSHKEIVDIVTEFPKDKIEWYRLIDMELP